MKDFSDTTQRVINNYKRYYFLSLVVGESKFLNANENATKVQLTFYENTVIAFVKLLNKCILCKIMTCLSINN